MSLQNLISEYTGEDTSRQTIAGAVLLTLAFPVYMYGLRSRGISPELLELLQPTFGVLELLFLLFLAVTAVKYLFNHVFEPRWGYTETVLPEKQTLLGGSLASIYAILCINLVLLHELPFVPLASLIEFILTAL